MSEFSPNESGNSRGNKSPSGGFSKRNDRGSSNGGRSKSDRNFQNRGDKKSSDNHGQGSYGNRERGFSKDRNEWGDRKNRRDGERSYGSRDRNSDNRGEGWFKDRDDRPGGDRRFNDRKDRRDGERPFGNRDRNFSDRDKRNFGERGERKFGEKKFSDRSSRNFEDRKNNRKFDRDDRRDGDRRFKERNERGERSFNDRNSGGRRYNNENRPAGGHQRGGQKQREERFQKEKAKAGYRPSKGQGPEFDTDVTGKELDGYILRQLRALEMQNAEVVAKNLVMVSRYLELDTPLAMEHAQAAVKRAGRIAAVREAAGITAYVAEDYEMALRELRTHRRISGSNEHYALLMDSERALGRKAKAFEMAEEAKNLELDAETRVEIALVISGIKHDEGDLQGAIKALEIPELDSKRGFEYSPRLFEAYADLLDEAGRGKEAARWMRLAVITEAALGQGDFAEPEIFDIFGEAELFEDEEKSIDLEGAEKVIEPGLQEEDDEAEDEDSAEEFEAAGAEKASHEITAESSVDDDIELEADVQEALNYSEENAQEDLLSIIEATEKGAH